MATFLIAACGGADPSPAVDADGGIGDTPCSELSYDTFGEAFLNSYCVRCHGPTIAENHIRLDSLAGLSASKKKALSEVRSKDMPPRGADAPTNAERAMFEDWIGCGAN